jgi:hypothetical protein
VPLYGIRDECTEKTREWSAVPLYGIIAEISVEKTQAGQKCSIKHYQKLNLRRKVELLSSIDILDFGERVNGETHVLWRAHRKVVNPSSALGKH